VSALKSWYWAFQTLTRPGTGSGRIGCISGTTAYQNMILDTGSPYGGPSPSRAGSNADMAPMNALYENNNLVLTREIVYVVPAIDNVATGANYQTLSVCPTADIGGGWAADVVHEQDGCANAWGDSVNMNGENGIGLCGCGFRRLNVAINGQIQSALVDTGTGFAMISNLQAERLGITATKVIHLASGKPLYFGNVQTTMLPNPEPVSMPWHIYDQPGLDGPGEFISAPINSITQRLNVVITRDYTIFISIGEGGALTYDCNSNQIRQGDILDGRWWAGQQQQASAKLANVI
jgi:hypothetical protein